MLDLRKGPSVQESTGDVRILPSDMGLGQQPEEDSFLVAYDYSAHESLEPKALAEDIHRATGQICNTGAGIHLAWADGPDILDPTSPDNEDLIEEMIEGNRPGQLGGYVGLWVVGESEANRRTASKIAGVFAKLYPEDESPRTLFNHTREHKPITITGPGFNLAESKSKDVHFTPFGIRKKAKRLGRVALISSAGPFVR